jgi:cytochrome c-type biogenesis protein
VIQSDAGASLGVAISFSAGLLSFLSPCVLPLIPSYVSFITGLSVEDVPRARRTALVHALLFVTGFTLVFVALGAAATALGQLLYHEREWIGRVGGVLVILLGLYLLGAFDAAALARERRVHIADKPLGYLGTILVGMAFAAGWTPCLGPILAAILTLASRAADVHRGIALLLAYSLGLGLPFVASALLVERFMRAFQRARRAMAWVQRVSGVLLIGVGLLMLTDRMTVLSTWLQRATPGFLFDRL